MLVQTFSALTLLENTINKNVYNVNKIQVKETINWVLVILFLDFKKYGNLILYIYTYK